MFAFLYHWVLVWWEWDKGGTFLGALGTHKAGHLMRFVCKQFAIQSPVNLQSKGSGNKWWEELCRRPWRTAAHLCTLMPIGHINMAVSCVRLCWCDLPSYNGSNPTYFFLDWKRKVGLWPLKNGILGKVTQNRTVGSRYLARLIPKSFLDLTWIFQLCMVGWGEIFFFVLQYLPVVLPSSGKDGWNPGSLSWSCLICLIVFYEV